MVAICLSSKRGVRDVNEARQHIVARVRRWMTLGGAPGRIVDGQKRYHVSNEKCTTVDD